MTIINTGRTVVSKYIRKQCPNDCRCTRCQREQSANPVLVYVSTLIEHIPDPEDIATEQYVNDAVSGIVIDTSNKADKVDGAVENNFSSLDSEGNLLDSGYAASDFVDSQDLQDHIDDTNNPHQVTAGQVGADVVGSAATVQGNLDTHELLTTTAHGGIVADTDPRLTDNRNPTLHASTHFASGTDEITPGDIGAIPVVNPATVGNLVTLAANGTLVDAGYAAVTVVLEPTSDGLWARLRASGVGSWLAAGGEWLTSFWSAANAAAARLAIGAAASAGSGTAGELATIDANGNAVRAGTGIVLEQDPNQPTAIRNRLATGTAPNPLGVGAVDLQSNRSGPTRVASGNYATTGGGTDNITSGNYATTGGGIYNITSGSYATTGGGIYNTTSGSYATNVGGRNGVAAGAYSITGGRRAKNTNSAHSGVLVLSDGNDEDATSTAANQATLQYCGGIRLITATDGSGTPTKYANIDTGGVIRLADDTARAAQRTELGLGSAATLDAGATGAAVLAAVDAAAARLAIGAAARDTDGTPGNLTVLDADGNAVDSGMAGVAAKRYLAHLTATSTIIATVGHSDFSTLTWSRVAAGHYRCTSAQNEFLQNKTLVQIEQMPGIWTSGRRISDSTVEIFFFDLESNLVDMNYNMDGLPCFITVL